MNRIDKKGKRFDVIGLGSCALDPRFLCHDYRFGLQLLGRWSV